MTMSMKPQDLIGHDVFDPDGEKIGRVETVYVGEESHEPEWVTVRTGLFGHRESFVPLAGARNEADGLRVGVRKDVVKDAPHVDAEGKLSEQEGIDLRRYYGLPIQRGGTGPVARPGGHQPPTTAKPAAEQASGKHDLRPQTEPDREKSLRDRAMRNMGDPVHESATHSPSTPGTAAHDKTMQNMAPQSRSTHAPNPTDPKTQARRDKADPPAEQIVVRSEERLRVTTERVEAGRVRLRKYVVTEPQQLTVQLTHEEIHVEREIIGETELATLKADPRSFAESVVEVTLHRDQPVVTKDTVPVERIRLATRPVTVEHTVTDEIRKEQFDIIDDTAKPGH
ncbi:putative conserved domain protein [Alloactinosynnema sp. L-07]|uniref:DUF2382 domain-containing protein n=1 Tax=Alloactinosynnema sp. L-07 TaxID=1653480 RepID=UPI00065EF24A|nr:PRC and DUF2382 domain-containing protein [Alloactinosynnema sp. L-07]CRK56024.1 putative conserved domain protein [Alloactinosynnema sp. L-07]